MNADGLCVRLRCLTISEDGQYVVLESSRLVAGDPCSQPFTETKNCAGNE
ncbi:MAG: hypothetical protein KME26_15015 [Oscillatoria princeps RMCB-10]|nr:hypothetical protein [Oscillatoria princeps RMCB-10]